MRALIIGIGGVLASGFMLLGVLVVVMGEGRMPVRRGSVPIEGPATYAMGVGWAALAVSIFCVSLLMAEVGSKYHVRLVRDWAFLALAISFIVTMMLAVHHAYAGVAL